MVYVVGTKSGGGVDLDTYKARLVQFYVENHSCEYNQSAIADEYMAEEANCEHGTQYYKSCKCGRFDDGEGAETFAANNQKEHDYKEVRADDYKVPNSDATCEQGTQYYKSCAVCGKASTEETFEAGDAKGHTYATTYTVGADTHWYAATCEHTDKKKDDHPHDYSVETANESTLASKATCEAASTYYYSCVCDAVDKREGAETFSPEDDATGHSFDTSKWEHDADRHWHASNCGHDLKKDEAEHTPSEWIEGIAAQVGVAGSQYKKCTVCELELDREELPALEDEDKDEDEDEDKDEDKDKDEDTGSGTSGGSSSSNKGSSSSSAFVQTAVTKDVCPKDNTCPIAAFTDMNPTERYHDSIHFCMEKKYMIGCGDSLFRPNDSLTRAMLGTILWRLDGAPYVNYALLYDDVISEQWYTEAVRWAASTGVMAGETEAHYGVESAMDYEQMVEALTAYAAHKQHTAELTLPHSDLTGSVVTRAQAADIFQSFCNSIDK